MLWRWHPGDKGWEVLPPLPDPGRTSHAMAEYGGDIYVLGGAMAVGANDVKNLNDAYRFNPTSKQWMRLPDLSIANRAWWAVGLGSSALVLAGYTSDFANAVYQYTPQHGPRLIGALPHALADTKFFLIHDVIVGTGGEVGPGVRGRWTLQTEVPESFLAKGHEKQDGAR